MKQPRGQQAAILRPRILDALGAVPLSTTELVYRMSLRLLDEGAKEDIRGVLIPFPTRVRCRSCGHDHWCLHEIPLGTGLVKPHLDALARAGLVEKFSRGNSRSALWTRAALVVPDTVEELLKERGDRS